VDLSKARRSLRASRRGVFSFSFRASRRLSGRASFTSARRVRLTRRSRARVVKLGSKRFRAASDGSVRVRIRLGRRALALLRRSGRLRVKVTVTAAGRRTNRFFTLRASRR
jgi:hypothetical protein